MDIHGTMTLDMDSATFEYHKLKFVSNQTKDGRFASHHNFYS